MHFTSSLLSLAFIASSIFATDASPLRPRYDGADAIARSMMGGNSNAVSWESMPLERSPLDPDHVILMAEREVLDKRIVYNPPITYPKKNTVWTAGQHETVKWTVDQNDIPANAKDYKGELKLGYDPADGSGGYNLKWTLAKDFPITQESIGFKLPSDLPTRSDYIVVLMGDSGNKSQKFTINAAKVTPAKAEAAPAPAPASTPASTNNDVSNDDESALAHQIITEVHNSIMGRDVI